MSLDWFCYTDDNMYFIVQSNIKIRKSLSIVDNIHLFKDKSRWDDIELDHLQKTKGNTFCLVLEKPVLLEANLLPLVLNFTVTYLTKDRKIPIIPNFELKIFP